MKRYKFLNFTMVILLGVFTNFSGLAVASSVPTPGTRDNLNKTTFSNEGIAVSALTAGEEEAFPASQGVVTAVDDSGIGFETDEETSFVTGNVLTNDSPPTGLSVQSVDTTGTMGSVTNNTDGTFNYNPNGQFNSLASGQSATDTFQYIATDGIMTDTATVSITINGVNDPPTDISLSSTTVDENKISGTTVGTFTTTDPDSGDSHTYSLASGSGDDHNGSFTITGSTLKTNAVFNFEAKSSYSIRVHSSDGSASLEKEFVISVNDVNENPTNISLSSTTVDENLPSGTTVGTFTTTDPDSGDSHTYSLVSGLGSSDNGSFTITGSTLKINAGFNFEAKSSYNIRVRSSDGGASFEKEFVISVNDVNENPTNISLSSKQVQENKPSGTTVGTFSTTDPDNGDSHTYSLVSGSGDDDNNSFTITGNTLKTDEEFNFEAKNTYKILVRTTDKAGSGLSYTEKYEIEILDVNEKPENITLSNNKVDENLPSGTTVGTFSTTDPDSGDSHTYSLVSGSGSSDNGSFSITGNTLKTNAVFDLNTKSTYNIRLRSTDSGNLTEDKQFTITVNDIEPRISVEKTASPPSVPEPGGDVDFTIVVTNISQEKAEINFFSDDVFCPAAQGKLLNPSDTFTCIFTKFVGGKPGDVRENTVSVTVTDNEGNDDFVEDSATVTITDQGSGIFVTKSASPTSVPEPGGPVSFTVRVNNSSAADAVTINSLSDNVHGNLNGKGNCAAGQTINPGSSYECSYSAEVSGVEGQSQTSTVTVNATDDDGNPLQGQNSATVTIGAKILYPVFLPLVVRPGPVELSVQNNNTGGSVTFKVLGTGVSCTIPNGKTEFCGSFAPGTYTVEATTPCGVATTKKTYSSGPQTTRVSCS